MKHYQKAIAKMVDAFKLRFGDQNITFAKAEYPFDIHIPATHFTIAHTFEAKDFAPGVWAGTEGLKMQVTKVDLVTRTITLEVIK